MTTKKQNVVADPIRDKAIEVSNGIVVALAKMGTVATRQPRKLGSSVMGGTSVSMRLYKKEGIRDRRLPGGYRLEIGTWNDDSKRNIPEPKAGFRFDDIALTVAHVAAAKRALNDRAARENAAAKQADAINAEIGVSKYGAMRAATNGHGGLILKCEASGTREQIVAAIRLAVELGMVQSDDDKRTCRQCFDRYKPSKRSHDDGFCSDTCEKQFDREIRGEADHE